MAEKLDEPPTSLQNLMCPLCLDIFEEATLLTCGHTFCRKCLKRYDASHQDLDHMVCPLCRKTTKFNDNRVEGLPANVTVNGLVDEYVGDHGGISAVFELSLYVFCIYLFKHGKKLAFSYKKLFFSKSVTCNKDINEIQCKTLNIDKSFYKF